MPVVDFVKSMAKLFAPPACAGCNRVGSLFCDDCVGRLRWIFRPICDICGRALKGDQSLCFPCMKQPPKLHTRAALFYGPPLSSAIHRLKYHGDVQLADNLGKLLSQSWREWRDEIAVDVVMPVPLHPQRLQQRGFNQAEQLAAVLCRDYQLALETNSLFRTRNTLPQRSLGARRRVGNVKSAFTVVAEVQGVDILLVDDVVTTGSTLLACAHALLDEGANSVTAFCLASRQHERAEPR